MNGRRDVVQFSCEISNRFALWEKYMIRDRQIDIEFDSRQREGQIDRVQRDRQRDREIKRQRDREKERQR